MKQMRRITIVGLLILLLLGLVACKEVIHGGSSSSIPDAATDPTTESTTEPTTEATIPKVGWIEENGDRYYYTADSEMTVGWATIDEKTYYFRPDGTMATGRVEIDGAIRWFDPLGQELLLVNPWYKMPEGYVPDVVKYNSSHKVDKACIESLKQMMADCKAAGNNPLICSSYRTTKKQTTLYNNKVNYYLGKGYSRADAEVAAGKVVAVPGTSEHQIGLAVDLVDKSNQNLNSSQEKTPSQKWFMANSWKYGWILRYPNDKSEITGIIYEPWHYRYVGVEVAAYIHESGLCLEEYLESITK